MNSPEPRFVRTAALIADPSRARMLTLLLGGEARSAGELARAVSIPPQTASTYLTQLLDAGLVKLRAHGRHRYFTLADADVAHFPSNTEHRMRRCPLLDRMCESLGIEAAKRIA